MENNPNTDVDKLISFGQIALEQGWYDQSREYFEQALALDPSNREATMGLVMAVAVPKPMRSEVFPGTAQQFRAQMQRLYNRCVIPRWPLAIEDEFLIPQKSGRWESSSGDRLVYREERQLEPTPLSRPFSDHMSSHDEPETRADITPETRTTWAVHMLPRKERYTEMPADGEELQKVHEVTLKEGGLAGIEAYEQPGGTTRVEFLDGYDPVFARETGLWPWAPPIGSAFEEFCEMIVRQMQLLMSTSEDAGKKPGPIDTKLDALLAGQTAIRENLSGLRQAMLARFDAGEQTIIAAVIEGLDQGQLASVQTVLNAIETGLVPIGELEETLVAVQHTLSEIQQQRVALPDSTLTSEVERLSEVVDAPKLDVRHKLKVTVPIIPVILSYEGEVELKSGLNLEAAWKRLVAMVRDT